MKKNLFLIFAITLLLGCSLGKNDPAPEGELTGEWLLMKAHIKITPQTGKEIEQSYGKAAYATKITSDGKITGIPFYAMSELMILGKELSDKYSYNTKPPPS